MRVLVFAPYAHWKLHVTDLELVQKHVEAGDDVTVLTCRGEMRACDNNPRQQASRCVRCIGRGQVGLRLIRGSYRVAPYYGLTPDQERTLSTLRTQFRDREQLTSFYVENFDIGWAVLSSLITRYRDPDVDLQARAFELSGLIRGSWTVYYSLRRRLQETPMDRVYVFNGRYAPLRAAFRACQAEQTDCQIHDVGHDHAHYALYHNSLPHDPAAVAREVNTAWAAGETDREARAAEWYVERAEGTVLSGKCFVGGQKAGQLPNGWHQSRRKIAVFTSSEDEFAAIGESWNNPLYDTQLHGLQRIARSMAAVEDTHLYIRVHPNLKGIHNRQTRGLRELTGPHLTVIHADEPVSTYALMKECDTVLTFGSTAGIEASYWRKPSILAGIALYRQLGATYNPRTHDELISLLSHELSVPDPLPALKYGYYQATFGEPYRYYEPADDYLGRFNGGRLQPGLDTWVRSRIAKFWPWAVLPQTFSASPKSSA